MVARSYKLDDEKDARNSLSKRPGNTAAFLFVTIKGMLQKSERLTRTQFDHYFKIGKRFHFKHYTITHSPAESLHASIVVGKKVAKKAVQRNTLRRRLYAQVYQHVKKPGHTGVFIVLTKPSVAHPTRQELLTTFATDIAEVLKKT